MSNFGIATEAPRPAEAEQQRSRLHLVKESAAFAVSTMVAVEWSDNHPYSSPTPAEIPLPPDYLPDYGGGM